jgi:hypothetical protein
MTTLEITNYPEGTLVTVQGTFRNSAGALADPSVVKVTTVDPDGIETTYTYLTDADVLKSSTGIYTMNIDTTSKRGLWLYTWFSTGTGQADSGEVAFYVE